MLCYVSLVFGSVEVCPPCKGRFAALAEARLQPVLWLLEILHRNSKKGWRLPFAQGFLCAALYRRSAALASSQPMPWLCFRPTHLMLGGMSSTMSRPLAKSMLVNSPHHPASPSNPPVHCHPLT